MRAGTSPDTHFVYQVARLRVLVISRGCLFAGLPLTVFDHALELILGHSRPREHRDERVRHRGLPRYACASGRRQASASAMWMRRTFAAPSKSAKVRATRSVRW